MLNYSEKNRVGNIYQIGKKDAINLTVEVNKGGYI